MTDQIFSLISLNDGTDEVFNLHFYEGTKTQIENDLHTDFEASRFDNRQTFRSWLRTQSFLLLADLAPSYYRELVNSQNDNCTIIFPVDRFIAYHNLDW